MRQAIEENLHKMNGAANYKVKIEKTELLTADVAVSNAYTVDPRNLSHRVRFTFILTRAGSAWKVARRIPNCDGSAPIEIIPALTSHPAGSPRFAGPGSSGYPG